jgi:hypothetical protein
MMREFLVEPGLLVLGEKPLDDRSKLESRMMVRNVGSVDRPDVAPGTIGMRNRGGQ